MLDVIEQVAAKEAQKEDEKLSKRVRYALIVF